MELLCHEHFTARLPTFRQWSKVLTAARVCGFRMFRFFFWCSFGLLNNDKKNVVIRLASLANTLDVKEPAVDSVLYLHIISSSHFGHQ